MYEALRALHLVVDQQRLELEVRDEQLKRAMLQQVHLIPTSIVEVLVKITPTDPLR